MMKYYCRIKRCLGKMMSSKPWLQLVTAAGLFVIVFLLVWLINYGTSFGKNLVLMLSPIPMKDAIVDNNGTYGDPLPVTIAYIIGLIFFSGVLIATITNMIRTTGERYINGTARFRFKGHILFLGYDEIMIGTLCREVEQNRGKNIVITVPNNVDSTRKTIYQYLATEDVKRVYVIQSSRVNVDDLKKKARVLTAQKIFVIGQPGEETHDAVNLKCLGLIAALNPKLQDEKLVPCYYYLRNQSTFYLIHRMEYQAENFRKDIESAKMIYDKDAIESFIKASEPFNFYESIARHVLFGADEQGKDTLQLNASKRDPHLVIYGMTPMGIALMRDVLMTQHFPGRRLHVTMVDENAKEEMHYLIGRHRPFFESCSYLFRDLNDTTPKDGQDATLDFIDVDVEFIQGDVANPKLAEYLRKCVEEEGDALTIAICTLDSPKNMALALYMPRQVFEAKVPIWVFQTGDNSMNSFVENDDKGNLYSIIRVFSTVDYGISDRGSSWQWQLAKAVGEDYAKKHPDEVGPDYRWESSQPKDRWSSLYGAISKIAMLRCLGKDSTPILLTEEELEGLAVAEHNRWNTEKLLNGWEPASLGVGKTLFAHDKIVSYDDLAKATKAKDLEQIEAVIRKLNQKGKESGR